MAVRFSQVLLLRDLYARLVPPSPGFDLMRLNFPLTSLIGVEVRGSTSFVVESVDEGEPK
jgi:hypothetical protein